MKTILNTIQPTRADFEGQGYIMICACFPTNYAFEIYQKGASVVILDLMAEQVVGSVSLTPKVEYIGG